MCEKNDIENSFKELSVKYSLPKTVTVLDAAEIMDISPKKVREYCKDGNLISIEVLEGSGKWRIETKQLMSEPYWNEFLEKRRKIKEQSKKIAEAFLKELE